MHCDVLAKDISVADIQPRRLAAIAPILGIPPENGEGVHDVVPPERRASSYDRVRIDAAAIAGHHTGLDHGKGADDDACTELGGRVDEGRRMYPCALYHSHCMPSFLSGGQLRKRRRALAPQMLLPAGGGDRVL
jgi:hypothetical protein